VIIVAISDFVAVYFLPKKIQRRKNKNWFFKNDGEPKDFSLFIIFSCCAAISLFIQDGIFTPIIIAVAILTLIMSMVASGYE